MACASSFLSTDEIYFVGASEVRVFYLLSKFTCVAAAPSAPARTDSDGDDHETVHRYATGCTGRNRNGRVARATEYGFALATGK